MDHTSLTVDRWMTNVDGDCSFELLVEYCARNPDHNYYIGDPAPTSYCDLDYLKKRGLVGIYQEEPRSHEASRLWSLYRNFEF